MKCKPGMKVSMHRIHVVHSVNLHKIGGDHSLRGAHWT